MALAPFDVWHLDVLRHTLALTAPRVSLSFFFWWKEPGNYYTTFYPTAWLPSPEDKALLGDRVWGREMSSRAMRGNRTTLGAYGDGSLSVPAWAMGDAADNLHAASFADTPDAETAAHRIAETINLDWLSTEGDVDPKTSALVRAWMDNVVAVARDPDIETYTMEFGDNLVPMALWMIEFFNAKTGITHDIWWPDRVLTHAY